MGKVAIAVVEINVPQSSPISFTGGTLGLPFEFQPVEDVNHNKLYRFVISEEPWEIYPVKDDYSLIGFIDVPSGIANRVKFTVQIVGDQGKTQKTFNIRIKQQAT